MPAVRRPNGDLVYPIRDTDGTLHAYHVRSEPKRFMWRTPDGSVSKGDIKRDDLPLYNSENVGDETVVWVTEGEKACDALVSHGITAVATVTGAGGCPTPAALRSLAKGRSFLLWPDHDPAGWGHMVELSKSLLEAGAVDAFIVPYRPTLPEANWDKGTDAADLFDDSWDDETVQLWVGWFFESWGQSVDPSLSRESFRRTTSSYGGSSPTNSKRKTTIRVSGGANGVTKEDFGSVSEALREVHGISNTGPGKNVRCPMHDDRVASLHILLDDKRAVCHGDCIWSGRGVIAGDIRRG